MDRRVFEMVATAGSEGMTIDELDAHFGPLGEPHHIVSARVNGLTAKRILSKGPDERRTRKRARAKVYRATAEALADFDALHKRTVKRTVTERCAHAMAKLTRRIAKQATEGAADLPSAAEAQRLVSEALSKLYAALER
jgi:hypothetical protein